MLLALVVLLAASLAAEHWLRDRAIERAAERLAEQLDAEVDLQVVGRPMLRNVVRRRLEAMTIVVRDLPVAGGAARVEQLTVDFTQITVEGPRRARIARAAGGSFHFQMQASELGRVVTLPSYLLSMELGSRGLRLQTMAGVIVDATVRLDTASLLVRPTGSVLRLLPQPSFRLPLPALPYGGHIEGFELHKGWFEAHGSLDPATLEVAVRWPRRQVASG